MDDSVFVVSTFAFSAQDSLHALWFVEKILTSLKPQYGICRNLTRSKNSTSSTNLWIGPIQASKERLLLLKPGSVYFWVLHLFLLLRQFFPNLPWFSKLFISNLPCSFSSLLCFIRLRQHYRSLCFNWKHVLGFIYSRHQLNINTKYANKNIEYSFKASHTLFVDTHVFRGGYWLEVREALWIWPWYLCPRIEWSGILFLSCPSVVFGLSVFLLSTLTFAITFEP